MFLKRSGPKPVKLWFSVEPRNMYPPQSYPNVKLEALAATDIVLVLYNPASRTRRAPWKAAVDALQRHRPAGTPAAAVRRAYRDGQAVEIADVGGLGRLEIDMETVVVVGSSRTRRHGPWFYTLRNKARI